MTARAPCLNYAIGVISGLVWYGHSLSPLEPWFWIVLLLTLIALIIDAAASPKAGDSAPIVSNDGGLDAGDAAEMKRGS